MQARGAAIGRAAGIRFFAWQPIHSPTPLFEPLPFDMRQ
jgi:hypothetical protein